MQRVARLLLVGGSSWVLAGGCAAGTDTEEDGGGGGGGAPPIPSVPVKGLTITDVDFYQTLEIPLVRGGAATGSTLPVVAGKEGYLRVGFTLDPSFAAREVRLKVTLESAAVALEPVEVRVPVAAASSHDAILSTLNAKIPGASILPDTAFRVDVLEADPKVERSEPAGSPAYPLEGTAALGAADVGPRTKIVLVPVVYQADGSGRMPDTSEGQVALYRSRTLGMFPTPAVEIELGAPWTYAGPDVTAFGNGWGEILTAFTNAHHGAGSDPTAYYYGLFAPAPSFDQYCPSGCVTGLSSSSDQPFFEDARSSVSLGFTGSDFADTFTHELGHAHGQLGHAPCGGAQSVDGSFPYPGGGIGVFGMDVAAESLKDPALFKDLMGYCDNTWISDYVYRKFFTRTQILGTSGGSYEGGAPERYRAFTVRPDGSLFDAGTSERTRRPGGAEVHVTARDATGARTTVGGTFLPFDHLPGGMLFVRDAEGVVPERLAP